MRNELISSVTLNSAKDSKKESNFRTCSVATCRVRSQKIRQIRCIVNRYWKRIKSVLSPHFTWPPLMVITENFLKKIVATGMNKEWTNSAISLPSFLKRDIEVRWNNDELWNSEFYNEEKQNKFCFLSFPLFFPSFFYLDWKQLLSPNIASPTNCRQILCWCGNPHFDVRFQWTIPSFFYPKMGRTHFERDAMDGKVLTSLHSRQFYFADHGSISHYFYLYLERKQFYFPPTKGRK